MFCRCTFTASKLQIHPFILRYENGSGLFKYFSFTKEHNFKLCQQMMKERHSMRNGFLLPAFDLFAQRLLGHVKHSWCLAPAMHCILQSSTPAAWVTLGGLSDSPEKTGQQYSRTTFVVECLQQDILNPRGRITSKPF